MLGKCRQSNGTHGLELQDGRCYGGISNLATNVFRDVSAQLMEFGST